MKELNEEKVGRWLGYIMIGCFCWMTYFNFQVFFLNVVDMFASLPLWWFLIVLPLFAMSVVWSISLGEEEIKELEEQIQENQQIMAHRERCLRLIHYEIQQIPPLQFVYYCSDLLRLLGYQEVKFMKDRRMSAFTMDGNLIYVECQCKNLDQYIEQERIEKLQLAMSDDDVSEGMFITTSSFSQEAIERAKASNIICVDKGSLSELILFATRESRKYLEEYTLRE